MVINSLGLITDFALSSNPTPASALSIPVVKACIDRIGSALSTCPILLYRKEGKRNVQIKEDPILDMLNVETNREAVAPTFKETLNLHYSLNGSGLADIVLNEDKYPYLFNISSSNYDVYRDNTGRIYYDITLTSGSNIIRYEENILNLKWTSWDGITAINSVKQLQTTLKNALQMRLHSLHWFENYANPSLVLTAPPEMGEDAIRNLKAQLDELRTGVGNSGKTMLLETGMTVEKLTDSFVNSQFEQLVRFLNGEIARFFGMQPHKVAIMDQANFANVEVMNAEFLSDTIQPLANKWACELIRKLLWPNPHYGRKYFFKFDLDNVNRAELLSRYQAWSAAISAGILSPNECREMEGRDPYDGGDDFKIALNLGDPGGNPADSKTKEDLKNKNKNGAKK